MKKTLLVLGIFLIGFSFSSCDEDDIVGLLPAFDVNLVKTEIIPVDIDQTNGDWVTYSNTTKINIVNNDTKDFLNKIKKVTINKLSYRIINFKGDPMGEVKGSFAVAGQVSLSNEFVVKTSADNGVVYQITEVAELNRIAVALKSGQDVVVEYSGSALNDDNLMDFDIEVTLNVKVTIDP